MSTWGTQRLDALINGAPPPPVVGTLQLGTLDAWGAGWAKKRWVAKPELLQADGAMFGGYLAALADQMLGFAAMTCVPGDKLFRTSNLTIMFHKLARGDLEIEAKVISQSSQVICARVEFKSLEGTLIAEATAQQILTDIGHG